MKKLTLLLLIAASALTISSCKKDKAPTENPAEAVKAKVLGKWNFESGTIITTNPPNPEKTENLTGRPGMYFEFRTNGISFNNLEGDAEEPYTVTSNTSMRIGDYTYNIKELTANRFVIESVQSNNTTTSRFTMILNR